MEETTQVNENPTGAALDPLVAPPVDQITVVEALRRKIDEFSVLVGNYHGSKKQLQQVMAYLAMHPFMESKPKFGYPDQQKVYDLGVEILTDKLLFLHIGIKEQEVAKEIKEKAEQQKEIVNGETKVD
jgi:hypothetical protein